MKDYKNRRTKENTWETIGQKFSLTAEEAVKKHNIHTLSEESEKRSFWFSKGHCPKDWRVCKPTMV